MVTAEGQDRRLPRVLVHRAALGEGARRDRPEGLCARARACRELRADAFGRRGAHREALAPHREEGAAAKAFGVRAVEEVTASRDETRLASTRGVRAWRAERAQGALADQRRHDPL